MNDPSSMRDVMVLCPSRGGLTVHTQNSVVALELLGAKRLVLSGCSNITLARNVLLTEFLDWVGPTAEGVVLLLDDDIVFDVNQAKALVDSARALERPVSALYSTDAGRVAATPRPGGHWLTGLGFMALRVDLLRKRAAELERVEGVNGKSIIPFCHSAPVEGRFLTEDYWFCNSFGGVELAQIGVRHFKSVQLNCDPFEFLRNYEKSKAETK